MLDSAFDDPHFTGIVIILTIVSVSIFYKAQYMIISEPVTYIQDKFFSGKYLGMSEIYNP
jgi:hypothetical protein